MLSNAKVSDPLQSFNRKNYNAIMPNTLAALQSSLGQGKQVQNILPSGGTSNNLTLGGMVGAPIYNHPAYAQP